MAVSAPYISTSAIASENERRAEPISASDAGLWPARLTSTLGERHAISTIYRSDHRSCLFPSDAEAQERWPDSIFHLDLRHSVVCRYRRHALESIRRKFSICRERVSCIASAYLGAAASWSSLEADSYSGALRYHISHSNRLRHCRLFRPCSLRAGMGDVTMKKPNQSAQPTRPTGG